MCREPVVAVAASGGGCDAGDGARDPRERDGAPTHPAFLLLADPDGRLTPELMDWDGDLLLERGSLVLAW